MTKDLHSITAKRVSDMVRTSLPTLKPACSLEGKNVTARYTIMKRNCLRAFEGQWSKTCVCVRLQKERKKNWLAVVKTYHEIRNRCWRINVNVHKFVDNGGRPETNSIASCLWNWKGYSGAQQYTGLLTPPNIVTQGVPYVHTEVLSSLFRGTMWRNHQLSNSLQ